MLRRLLPNVQWERASSCSECPLPQSQISLTENECSCSSHCSKCEGVSLDCLVCDSSYRLQPSSPVTCDTGFPSGFTENSDSLSDCVPCDPGCSTCFGTTPFSCLTCKSGEDPDQYSSCSYCPSKKYLTSDMLCSSCHSACSDCSFKTFSDCLSCPSDQFLYANQSCSDCPSDSPFFPSDHFCLPCHESCETCIDSSPNGCLTCTDKSLISVKFTCIPCLEAGPNHPIEDEVCKMCHSSSETCNGSLRLTVFLA